MPVYEGHLAGLGYDLEAIHAITYLDRAMKRGELDYVSDGVQIALGSPAIHSPGMRSTTRPV